MTESCSCITAHPPEKYDYKYAFRVGTIVASTEVKIIDEEGKECGLNEPGEICARGPQIVMGYLNNEKATKETFDADGFLHTGDVGALDEEGLITITDRKKELVKVKGERLVVSSSCPSTRSAEPAFSPRDPIITPANTTPRDWRRPRRARGPPPRPAGRRRLRRPRHPRRLGRRAAQGLHPAQHFLPG